MPDTDAQAHSLLMRHPVPAFADGATVPAALGELARLADDLAELIRTAWPDPPTAHDIAGHHRRRAHVLTQLAAEHPEYKPAAGTALQHWQQAEAMAVQEAVGHV